MCGLFDMMMGRLDAYQFISPHICLVCQKTKLIVEHLIDTSKEVHCETVVKAFEAKVFSLHQEALDSMSGLIQLTVQEIGVVIKHELKRAMAKEIMGYMSPDKKNVASSSVQQHSQVGSRSAGTKIKSMESKSDIQQANGNTGKKGNV